MTSFKTLILIFIIGIAAYILGGVTVHRQLYPFSQLRKIKIWLSPSKSISEGFKPRNSLFHIFHPKAQVVMIGDSLTQRAEWSEIFPGITIANRGIDGDTSDDILKRIDQILLVEAKKAFIMLGINDINFGSSVEEIIDNYIKIILILKRNNITVYIQSTLECNRNICGETLTKIRLLNEQLKYYADKEGLIYININEDLTDINSGLLFKFSPDGVHLLGSGYLIWSKKISYYII